MTTQDKASEITVRPAILVVDDENALLVTIRASLSEAFDIETANNAEEAELLMESRRYDAVVCDHMLPGEQGLEFLIRMSVRHPATKRILVTGYVNPDFLSRSLGVAKLSACLLKPAKASALAAAILSALAKG